MKLCTSFFYTGRLPEVGHFAWSTVYKNRWTCLSYLRGQSLMNDSVQIWLFVVCKPLVRLRWYINGGEHITKSISGFQIAAKRPIVFKLACQCITIQLPMPLLAPVVNMKLRIGWVCKGIYIVFTIITCFSHIAKPSLRWQHLNPMSLPFLITDIF